MTTKFLTEYSISKDDIHKFTDISSHWIFTDGWMNISVAAGIVIPSDYSGGKFEPDRNITRQEMTVMCARSLGLAYLSQNDKGNNLSFKDKALMETSVKGYISQISSLGIIKGYPDGHFGGKKTATRAEAVTIIKHALGYMTKGVDPQLNIKLPKDCYSTTNDSYEKIYLAVPAQVINGLIYAPARSIYGFVNNQMHPQAFHSPMLWKPYNQTLDFDCNTSCNIQAGYDKYGVTYYSGKEYYTKYYATRMLYGEIMIPVYDTNTEKCAFNIGLSNGVEAWNSPSMVWEPSSKTLIINI